MRIQYINRVSLDPVLRTEENGLRFYTIKLPRFIGGFIRVILSLFKK